MNNDNLAILIYRISAPLIVIIILIVASCSSQPAGPPPTPTPSVSRVEIIEKEFTIQPGVSTVNAGTVIFEIKNEGFIEHNFVIEGHDDHVELILPQETKTFEVELAPGNYQLICDLPGHKEAGMVAEFTVK